MFPSQCCWHQQLKMALCLPDTVPAHMRLLWGSTGSSHSGFREDSWGQERLQGPPAAHPPGSARLCQASYLHGVCLQPFSAQETGRPACVTLAPASLRTLVLVSFFQQVTGPCSFPRTQHHQLGICLPGPASDSAAAVRLPSAPARRMLRAVQSSENNSVAPPPLTTTAAYSPPEKAKPKACNPQGSPFSSTVEENRTVQVLSARTAPLHSPDRVHQHTI